MAHSLMALLLVGVVVDGLNINAKMIRLGMAWQYVQYNDDSELAAMEAEARQAKRGLWSDSQEPIPPWEWRKKK